VVALFSFKGDGIDERQSPAMAPGGAGRSAIGLISVWLYRLRPSGLNAVTIVKPETVAGWHREGLAQEVSPTR
jgi:hypothetical protein